MVNATPYANFFGGKTFDNKLKVKLPENTIGAPDEEYTDATDLILLFESLGAIELASITRQDLVGGIGLNYEIVGQVDNLTREVTARMLQAAPVPAAIDISKYIALEDIVDETLPGIMIDDEGNLVISLLQLGNDEAVEVQVLSGGNMIKIPYGLEED